MERRLSGFAIGYDTMWHSTERMTAPLIQGIKDEGVDCTIIKLRAAPRQCYSEGIMEIKGMSYWNADMQTTRYSLRLQDF